MFSPTNYLSELLIDGPPAARCELLRPLSSDDFGPRVLARLRDDETYVTVHGMAIADAAWSRAATRLRALAGVQEDHISPLLAYGRHEGLAYFIHAHEDGPRLDTLLREHDGRLPLSQVLPLFAQVLLAVGRAHHRGVVVGGVRPQDVRLLPSAGEGLRIRIRNLGLAAVLGVPAGRRNATDHPSIYRAPESDVALDPASDVFSLGVLFIRMLTGPLPRTSTEAERGELLRARVEHALHEDPSFTDGLATVVLEATDGDLATRPRDAQQLLGAMLEVVPASALRLPVDSPRMEAFVDEDGSTCWPARPWTERVRPLIAGRGRATARPPHHPRPAHTPATTAPATAQASPTPDATVLPMRRPTRRRGMLGRIAIGAGLLSTGAALALAVVVGEPGITPTAVTGASMAVMPAASLAAITDAPAPAIEGTLEVEAMRTGEVTIDGRPVGSTPYRGTVTPGRHVVRVEAAGHRTWRAAIDVTAGEVHRLDAALEPAAAESELAMSSLSRGRAR
ncbi:PEGA domain-containing protein [Paraliomyxa miuraensis]|uniref:PEGA domain-containing protein n=1 Tax=Paraliomyxa miuraensis TaxID=376150 RepID=UPI00225B0B39|nr:PEGA domain-containing protein [Paraliomyxa miuraensis]MCX4241773.1 PEGA domain-containing protein [Paraliomyxa miuraensis]